MSTADLNLGDIPDLGSLEDAGQAPIENGWYAGTILGTREFTDKNGNDRVFESTDTPSAKGDSRNIRLQIELKRQSDGKTLNTSALVNYKPEILTQETVQQVAERKEQVNKGEKEWGDLFGPFMSLARLAQLQKIAGVRQLQRNGNGGLDLHPLFGKTGYFRLKDDDRNPQYKQVAAFQVDKPKRAPVL